MRRRHAVPRKARTIVVLDTNVFLRFLLNRNPSSANARVVLLWLIERRLQLVVNPQIHAEYVEVLERKKIDDARIRRFEQWMQLPTVTHVRNGSSRVLSRDPKDNPYIDAAEVGRAAYIVSNDRHLLDIPAESLRGLRFQIVKPHQFLAALEE